MLCSVPKDYEVLMNQKSDFNTCVTTYSYALPGWLTVHSGEFTQDLTPGNLVDFQRFTVKIAGVIHEVSGKYVRFRIS